MEQEAHLRPEQRAPAAHAVAAADCLERTMRGECAEHREDRHQRPIDVPLSIELPEALPDRVRLAADVREDRLRVAIDVAVDVRLRVIADEVELRRMPIARAERHRGSPEIHMCTGSAWLCSTSAPATRP